jgi:hypothetical protein
MLFGRGGEGGASLRQEHYLPICYIEGSVRPLSLRRQMGVGRNILASRIQTPGQACQEKMKAVRMCFSRSSRPEQLVHCRENKMGVEGKAMAMKDGERVEERAPGDPR